MAGWLVMGLVSSWLWPDLELAKMEGRIIRYIERRFDKLDRRIDHMAEDLTKIKAAEAHIIAALDGLAATAAALAERLANIKVDDPQTQIDIDAIADELEAAVAKVTPVPPVEPPTV